MGFFILNHYLYICIKLKTMKKFFPTICPECHEPLSIQYGKTDDVTKLVTPQSLCWVSHFGIIISEIIESVFNY